VFATFGGDKEKGLAFIGMDRKVADAILKADVPMAPPEPVVPSKRSLPPKTPPAATPLAPETSQVQAPPPKDAPRPSTPAITSPLDELLKRMNIASKHLETVDQNETFCRIFFDYMFHFIRSPFSEDFKKMMVEGKSLSSTISELNQLCSPPAPAAITTEPPPPVEDRSPPKKKIKVSKPAPLKKPVPTPPVSQVEATRSTSSPPMAPKVESSKPSRSARRRLRRRCASHTTHGLSRRGIYLTPPKNSVVSSASFTTEIIADLNNHLRGDLKSDLVISSAHSIDSGIHLDTNRTPTSADTAFVLKHVRRLFPIPKGEPSFASITPSSTSFIKVLDVPIVPGTPQTWALETRAAFSKALELSPMGKLLIKHIKHVPRIMCNSAHSDSCTAWIDLHDTLSGTNAAALIGKFIPFGGVNCHIAGARPHPGSLLCAWCQKWGHHANQCRSQRVRCSLCGGPHSEANHSSFIKVNQDKRHCVNCSASKQTKTQHASTDRKCPFWQHRFDRDWLKRQFKQRD
jgi:hypothetical protein